MKAPGGRFLLLPGLLSLTPTGPHILLFCHLRQKLEKICDMICSNDNSSNGKCDGIKTPLGHHLTGLPTFLCHLNLTRAQFTF